MMKESDWIYMTLEDLKTPKPGRLVFGPRWWAVNERNEVLFFRSYGSPQCNKVREIVERIRPGLRTEYVEIAFIPHNCSDYV